MTDRSYDRLHSEGTTERSLTTADINNTVFLFADLSPREVCCHARVRRWPNSTQTSMIDLGQLER